MTAPPQVVMNHRYTRSADSGPTVSQFSRPDQTKPDQTRFWSSHISQVLFPLRLKSVNLSPSWSEPGAGPESAAPSALFGSPGAPGSAGCEGPGSSPGSGQSGFW